jgi:glycosyltransferase involved in cell wall biosynthesis
MKVLHVIPSIDPALGGPTEVVLNLVRALRENGIDAEIATTNDRGSELLDVPLHQRVEYEQVPIWFFPRFSPPLKEFIFSAALTRWLWQHARDYDLIETHYLFSYAPACAALIARLQGIPYTMRTMGQLTPWALSQSWLKKQIYSFLIERHNLNCADMIHCTALGEAQDVRKFGIQTPSFTLPLGVDRPVELPDAKQKLYETYGIPTTTPVVLFLSRLHPKKRPDLLIQALSQLVAQNHNFHLILAGSGEPQYLNYLTDLVSSLGLSSRTSITGFVMGRDKDLLLQASDLFVLPSFSENFGIAVAEAMVVGLPVVVTPDIQISPEIAAASAGVVVEGQIAPLTNAIAQLLSSPELRQQLGENGRLLASQRYSWQAIAQNLISIYTAAIERQPIPTTFSNPENFVTLP